MRILIEKGKHGDSYWNAEGPENLAKASLAILTRNYEYDWYYEPSPPAGEDESHLTEEQIEALPTERLKEEARQLVHRYQQQVAIYKLEKAEWNELVRVVEEQDDSWTTQVNRKGKQIYVIPAWDVLQSRRDWEYENVYLEDLIEP